jgi:beta-glucanase (GH16 family)
MFTYSMLKNLVFLSLLFVFPGKPPVKKATTANPKWVQMFNGKDLTDWHPKIRYHDLDDNFKNTFRVENGLLEVRYDQYDNFNETYGHIFYKKPYSYYLIGVEYRFVGEQCKGGAGWAYKNNGIMIHGQPPETMKKDQDFPNSIEVQLLGGSGKGNRPTANVCTPGTQYENDGKIITQHCTDSKAQTYNGDQWVRVEALVLGDSLVVHYVNGEEVMRYQKPQTDPPKGEHGEGTMLKSGSISLQSESHPTDFRKIEIIDLEKYAKDPKKLQQVIAKLMSEKRVAKQ